MRLAFAITAYKDIDLLNKLIKQILTSDNCYVFIHIDLKSDINLDNIHGDPRVIIIAARKSVEWGDFAIVQATNAIFNEINEHELKFDYVTILSGQDLLLISPTKIVEYLEKNKKIELYMDVSRLPVEGWTSGGGYERILLYYPKIFRKRYNKNHPIHTLRAGYSRLLPLKILPKKKLPKNIEFWGGSAWFTVGTDLLSKSLKYIDENPWYDAFFSGSMIPDEMYFATLYMNLANRKKVLSNNNFVYIDWNNPNKNENASPKTFDISDKANIEASDKFFARKFSTDKDNEIIKYFYQKVIKQIKN